MEKLKRFCAVVLCCMLSIQGCFVFAADSLENTQGKLPYPELAVCLGLLDADIMGRLDTNITRGELTAAIARFIGVEGDEQSVFSDVPADHPYAKEISSAQKVGLVNGYGDGTFRPDEEATYAQALKLCVYLAGYGELIEGGMSVESAAIKSKLFSKMRLSNSPTIMVREAAEMLVRAGDVEVLEFDGVSNTHNEYIQNGTTVFNTYLDIYKEEGIISANGNTGIYENLSLDEDKVMLEEEIMTDLSGSAGKLLGYNVTAYVRREKGGEGELLYAYANNKNKITNIPAINFKDFNNGVISFKNENGRSDKISFRMSSVATIYNGVLTMSPVKEDFEVETGSITLIDNDGDSGIDVVNIEKYENCIVDAVDKVNNEIWFKFGSEVIKLDDLDNVKLLSSDNKPIDLRELAQWDVLSVARSKKEELVTVVYIPGEVEGTVSAMYGREEKKIDIDGITYNIAEVFMNNLYDEIYIGRSANFYFDIDGKIACYNLGSNDEEYCYLIAVEPGNGFDKEPKIKLMNSMEDIEILTLAKKVELDGTKKLLKNSEDRDVLRALDSQLIIAKRNSSGEICYIDTVQPGPADGLRLIFEETNDKTMKFRKNAMMFFDNNGHSVAVTSNTVYMYVPESTNDRAKKAENEDFFVYNIAGLANDSKHADLKAYTKGDSMIAEVLFRTHNPESGVSFEYNDDQAVCVVDEIKGARNNRDEWVYKITLYSDGKMQTYFTEENVEFIGYGEDGANVRTYIPKKGDIVKIKTNRNNEIRGIKEIFSAKRDALEKGEVTNQELSNLEYYKVQVAYAYKKEKSFLQTTTTNLSSPDYTDGVTVLENVELKNLGAFKIYVYDSEEDILSVGSAETVRDFKGTNGDEASKLFIYERNGEARVMCIYR